MTEYAIDRVYENIYKGLQKREQIVNPSDEPIPQEHPGYEQYKRERKESLDKDGEESPWKQDTEIHN
jgi:hypothetical protein